eukprot:720996_1
MLRSCPMRKSMPVALCWVTWRRAWMSACDLVGEDSQPSGAVKAGKDLVAGLKKALSGGQKALGGGGRKANTRSCSRKKRKLVAMDGSEDAAPEFPEISDI